MYLSPELNRDQIRAMYALVAKALLPIDGNLNALNAEYAQAMDAATRKEMGERSNASYEHQAATNERIRNVIEAVLRLGFEAEVLGWWVWVGGTVKGDPRNATLKTLGCAWSSKKGKWFFAGIPSRNRKEWGMDRIRAEHGADLEATE